jgi:glycosyltransferase involved in cell wall biosynthesis
LKDVALLYLGRKGGGAKFTDHLARSLAGGRNFRLTKIIVRKDIENIADLDIGKVITPFSSSNLLLNFVSSQYFKFNPKRLLNRLGLKSGDLCLVPMISPLGMGIERILKKNGVKVVRFLHDANRHPGDFWPRKITINRIIAKEKFLLVLSETVARDVHSLNPGIVTDVYPHPIFTFKESSVDPIFNSNYILFIGRIRSYKGIPVLVESFLSLNQTDLDLVIAGDGRLSGFSDPRIKTFNKWLNESEIHNLVKFAKVVVFPYMEASQSGLVPYVMSVNKKIVITPLEGFIEQTRGYKNCVISEAFDSRAIAEAILKSLNRKSVKDLVHTEKISIDGILVRNNF